MTGRTEAWLDYTRDWQDSAPDVRVIWSKRPRALRPHLCSACNAEIAVGEIYESIGAITDGEFLHEKLHLGAYQYPSGCPARRAKDLAELHEAEAG